MAMPQFRFLLIDFLYLHSKTAALVFLYTCTGSMRPAFLDLHNHRRLRPPVHPWEYSWGKSEALLLLQVHGKILTIQNKHTACQQLLWYQRIFSQDMAKNLAEYWETKNHTSLISELCLLLSEVAKKDKI